MCPACQAPSRPSGILCPACLEEASSAPSRPVPPPGIEAIATGPELTPALRALVHGLKYEGHRAASRELVDVASDRIPVGFCPESAVLVPVPLHPPRRRDRGYNQSDLLAARWKARTGRPAVGNWLCRTRDTGTQTKLGSGERRRNLEGAFAVGKGFRSGVPVVLVDDVLTTGATLSACAAVLLAAGAPSVRAICAAWAGEA